jgi:hypothetical protein
VGYWLWEELYTGYRADYVKKEKKEERKTESKNKEKTKGRRK